MSLNEITNKYQVTFDSGYKNYFKVHIGDKIFKFTDNKDRIYLSKLDNIFLEISLKKTKGL